MNEPLPIIRRRVRVGVVQLAMRPMSGPEAFFEHASFFLEAMAGYGADFVCFPEYVNAPLMAPWKTAGAPAAIRHLAELTAPTRDFFSRGRERPPLQRRLPLPP
jgi:predicted amidohydrolase